MIVTFLTAALPPMLGYSLFVGVSGRLNPASRPLCRQDRASWALGLWIGIAVSVVAAMNARVIYVTPAERPAVELLVPAAYLLACLIIPALGIFALYRHRMTRAKRKESSTRFDWTLRENDLDERSANQVSSTNDLSVNDQSPETDMHADRSTEVIPTYLETIQTGQMVNHPHQEAVNDPDDTGPSHKASEMLQIETALREETEKHLRITRKALAVLEATTRNAPVVQAAEQSDLEQRLVESLAATAALEANAMQEKAKRLESEQQAIELKQKVINAKREIRRGAAARAKALSTANKSIAFARQSVQIRTRLESELEKAQDAINIRQKTISSLASRLDKEKRRTREEIGSVARQLVLQDRHHKARRSLEEVARSVENNLASRLVKKVAKAKPLMPDTDQSNLGQESAR